MRKEVVMAFGLLLAIPALAQYKCVINGKTVYADAPCAPDARHVGRLEDRVSAEQHRDRQILTARQKAERDRIETREERQLRADQEALADQRQRQAKRAADEKRERAYRCDSARRELRRAERAGAAYQDLQMRRSAQLRENEIRELRGTVDRECSTLQPE